MQVFVSVGEQEKRLELPGTVDVLIHLPESSVLREQGLCIAHAVQYNISAKGTNPDHAIARLADLLAVHCRLAIEQGIDPVNMTSTTYMKAFFLGIPISAGVAHENINARLSQELARHLGAELQGDLCVAVRDICEKQRALKIEKMDEFVKAAAA